MTRNRTTSSLALIAIVLLTSATLEPANGQTITETLKLLPGDGSTDDEFGRTLAISGTTAIVGAWGDDDNAPNTGSAYLFNAATGAQLFKLHATDATRGDQFGTSVAISGSTAIIGAYQDDDNGIQSGSAYLFDTTTGNQLAKLLPSDGTAGDLFGYCVSISGNTALVGAPNDDDAGGCGSAYLFDTTTGAQLAKLLPNDGSFEDRFGSSLSISGNTAIVGSVFDDDNGSESGSAYLFDATTGAQIDKLLPTDGAVGDQFGIFVAISGTTAIIGAFHDDDNGSNSGSAYLFDTLNGNEITKLLPSDGAPEHRFGRSVAISGPTAIVGATKDDDTETDQGSAYLFNTSTGTQLTKLLPTDGAPDDRFGRSVSISGTIAMVGAFRDDENGPYSGSAYLYDVPSPLDTSFCYGDGTGTPCPCGNSGGPGEGCANDTGAGALLDILGSTSVTADDLVLSTTGLPPGPGLYFQGENAINNGNGIPFGDGLRCAGMDVTRLEVRFSSGGAAQTTISIATKGGVNSGETKRYQHWYRDTGVSPCGNLFNLSNGYELTWTP